MVVATGMHHERAAAHVGELQPRREQRLRRRALSVRTISVLQQLRGGRRLTAGRGVFAAGGSRRSSAGGSRNGLAAAVRTGRAAAFRAHMEAVHAGVGARSAPASAPGRWRRSATITASVTGRRRPTHEVELPPTATRPSAARARNATATRPTLGGLLLSSMEQAPGTVPRQSISEVASILLLIPTRRHCGELGRSGSACLRPGRSAAAARSARGVSESSNGRLQAGAEFGMRRLACCCDRGIQTVLIWSARHAPPGAATPAHGSTARRPA